MIARLRPREHPRRGRGAEPKRLSEPMAAVATGPEDAGDDWIGVDARDAGVVARDRSCPHAHALYLAEGRVKMAHAGQETLARGGEVLFKIAGYRDGAVDQLATDEHAAAGQRPPPKQGKVVRVERLPLAPAHIRNLIVVER